ncbi:MAG: phytanoyl-CoA dioxygenase family protein [Alphaproteobacteria bacterium]
MTPEQVLSQRPTVLTQEQRVFYFENGYLLLESFISKETVAKLNAVTAEFVEQSREVAKSDAIFDLAPSHTAARPRIRRLKHPEVIDERYWEYAQGRIADVAADLVGPNVVFHHSKLNFKWHEGGDEVRWHQDIQFYPQTNYSSLTIGTYLEDTALENGPLAVLPGSHEGPLYELYDDEGRWQGCLKPRDAARLDRSRMALLEGPAGSITIHNCRAVHGSPPSVADSGRPLLLNCYNAADSFPYVAQPAPSVRAQTVVRGVRPKMAHLDPRPCPLPPDWTKGYTTIFAAQAGESVYG